MEIRRYVKNYLNYLTVLNDTNTFSGNFPTLIWELHHSQMYDKENFPGSKITLYH